MRIVKKEKKPMGRPRKNEDTPLTDKQIAFVKEFVAHDGMITKKQAAINAGYANVLIIDDELARELLLLEAELRNSPDAN